jgi:hypothetical protein
MGDRFPFKVDTGLPLRSLWTRQAYRYLSNFFKTFDMDPRIQAEGGVLRIRRPDPMGRNCGIPVGGGAGSGQWSGLVIFEGDTLWDFSRVDAAPTGELLEGGLAEGLGGIYLKIAMADGATTWVDERDFDTDEYNYYPVGVQVGEGEDAYYILSTGHVVGDIRIDYTAWIPEAEA